MGMKKWLMGLAVGLAIGMSAIAADVALNPEHPDSYVVVKGDTLWDISAKFLQKPWLWPEIWHINPQIENPHLIFPGDVLTLVYVDGKPRLNVRRGDASNTVKLGPSMRSEPLDNAIPAIPLDEINAFLSKSRFVDPGELEGAPYVVAGSKRNIVSGAGDEIYGRGEFEPGRRLFGIYREGRLYRDPGSDEILGIQALDIGEAKKISQEGDVATLQLNRTTQEVRNGDRLLPNQDRPLTAEFQPSAPEQTLNGVILDVQGGVTQVGSMNVVMVNLGARDGLTPGNVMAIYKLGEVVRDDLADTLIKLPDVRAGLLMYFSVYDRMSYALVLRSDRPLEVGDRVDMP
jgi:nucleoid-associated protein YgaU